VGKFVGAYPEKEIVQFKLTVLSCGYAPTIESRVLESESDILEGREGQFKDVVQSN
jgi:hypothetical protein